MVSFDAFIDKFVRFQTIKPSFMIRNVLLAYIAANMK